ncbi:7939_t:CDS:2, partial [Entrophospora sp. SA101]
MFLISKPQINTDIYLSHYGVFNITCMYKVVSKPLETNHILRPYIGTFLPKEMNLSGANGQGANLVYLSIDVGNNYTFRNDIDVVDRPTRALKRMMLMQVLDSEVSTVTNNQSIITVAITPQNFIVQEEVEQ